MSSTMPSWSTARHTQCFLPAILMAELERPLSYGLVADDDAACGQHLLDHAQAEREAEVQPNRVADDLGRKAVASVAGEGRRRHPVRLPALLPIRKRPATKLTAPWPRKGFAFASASTVYERNRLLAHCFGLLSVNKACNW